MGNEYDGGAHLVLAMKGTGPKYGSQRRLGARAQTPYRQRSERAERPSGSSRSTLPLIGSLLSSSAQIVFKCSQTRDDTDQIIAHKLSLGEGIVKQHLHVVFQMQSRGALILAFPERAKST